MRQHFWYHLSCTVLPENLCRKLIQDNLCVGATLEQFPVRKSLSLIVQMLLSSTLKSSSIPRDLDEENTIPCSFEMYKAAQRRQ